jgi:thioesterase domain-containing protein/acyl carrier protein
MFLQGKLPKYMVPSSFVVLPELPLNAQGKVDRQALPDPQSREIIELSQQEAPKDPTEVMLVALWKKSFAVESVSVHDNFFELGGHSLMALRFFAELEKSTGLQLPLATLFEAPTIRQLATIIRAKGWQPPWSCLVPIKPSGTRPPLYIVHGVGGNILIYSDLARYLGHEQPVYGIQSLGLDGKQVPFTRVEDMAARYIKEIRMFQPSGPYQLAGLCFGGVVAFEMARQLSAIGERVPVVVLMDTFVLPDSTSLTYALRNILAASGRRARYHLDNLVTLSLTEKVGHLRQSVQRLKTRIRIRFWQLMAGRKKSENVSVTSALRIVRESNTIAARKYRAVPYHGKVILFLAREGDNEGLGDPIEQWQSLAKGGVQAIWVPGDHVTIVREPQIRELAQRLDECLLDINGASARD